VSTTYNRRNGSKANAPRRPRLCRRLACQAERQAGQFCAGCQEKLAVARRKARESAA